MTPGFFQGEGRGLSFQDSPVEILHFTKIKGFFRAFNQGEKKTREKFSHSLVVGIIPTFGFPIAAWISSRAGVKLFPMILIGYGV